ncbi:hypothetical protein K1T73_12975 [Roseovarius sp. SCSIO 43702]|uniref:hypothetical protein n=1 Tax=Roseovarius sp. SCSIO 43702 TaxID=2823043 RepID=UPI001C72B1B3|nr:hypothetical protein [Roseovarius sp. SCSIO 43702]QYX55972.1 hypothetical protein K1T73_12975 [Roseovarius sp. SCSIO 43702]
MSFDPTPRSDHDLAPETRFPTTCTIPFLLLIPIAAAYLPGGSAIDAALLGVFGVLLVGLSPRLKGAISAARYA